MAEDVVVISLGTEEGDLADSTLVRSLVVVFNGFVSSQAGVEDEVTSAVRTREGLGLKLGWLHCAVRKITEDGL